MVWCEFGADHKCTLKYWEVRTEKDTGKGRDVGLGVGLISN